MKHIKKFQNEDEYQEFVESEDYVTPNLVWCVAENKIVSNTWVPAGVARIYIKDKEYFEYIRNHGFAVMTATDLIDGQGPVNYQEYDGEDFVEDENGYYVSIPAEYLYMGFILPFGLQDEEGNIIEQIEEGTFRVQFEAGKNYECVTTLPINCSAITGESGSLFTLASSEPDAETGETDHFEREFSVDDINEENITVPIGDWVINYSRQDIGIIPSYSEYWGTENEHMGIFLEGGVATFDLENDYKITKWEEVGPSY